LIELLIMFTSQCPVAFWKLWRKLRSNL